MHDAPSGHACDELGAILAAEALWRSAGHRTAIATVTQTWGSAPRRPGSHLVVRDDGLFEGSVSGGCVEGDVIAQAIDVIVSATPRLLSYGVEDDNAWSFGLPCGGTVEILIQPVSDAGFPPTLLNRIARERPFAVTTDLDFGRSRSGHHPGDRQFVQVYQPRLRLAVVGAVHIAQALLPIAGMLGYQTLLIDPRTAFACADRFPGARIDSRWPDEALAEFAPDAGSAVIVLSHDPKIDDPALIAALASPAFYVGALGSRRNAARRRERLAAHGLDAAIVARIHGPVGLAIGAVGPAEIALSIMAGITQAWRMSACLPDERAVQAG